MYGKIAFYVNNSFSAGIDFGRHNLSSIDVR